MPKAVFLWAAWLTRTVYHERLSWLHLQLAQRGYNPTGEYLLPAVQGPAQVKASALTGAILPGDLLSTAGATGYAGKAATMSAGPSSLAI